MRTIAAETRAGLYITLLALAFSAAALIYDPFPAQILRNITFDQFQRIRPRPYREAPVKIIDIDEESLSRLGQWPWPRTRIAELIGRLQPAEPRAITFDILFAEPDRTSPQAMLSIWPLSKRLRNQIEALPDHDQRLGEALSGGKVVLGFSSNRQGPKANRFPDVKARFVEIGGPLAKTGFPDAARMIVPLPQFSAAAAGIGALNFIPDADGVVRRIPLLFKHQHLLFPALAADTLRVAENSGTLVLVADAANENALHEVRIGSVTIPTTPQGEMWIRFTRPAHERYLPAWKILNGSIDPALLRNRILLVGTSAQGLMDLRFNPLGDIIPGIEIHAQALEQMLAGDYLVRPSWSKGLELLLLTLGGLAIGLTTLNAGALLSSAVFAGALVLLWFGAWQAYAVRQWLLDPTLTSIAWSLAFLLAGIFRLRFSERRQRWLKDAFARYISPNRVEHLLSHPEALELGGRRQVCSFVFSDLADFTGLMEKMDPGEAVALLNRYLDEMIAIAFKHQGTLDRIVGDAVAIMFSAPLEQEDHRLRALNCALDMQRFASRYSRNLNARGIRFGNTRIGVHSGEVIVGNFGGRTIFDYRALGDPVNTASRLEGANKYLGTSICVSEATLAGCPEALARPVGRLRVKGKSLPLRVFEPVDGELSAKIDPAGYCAAYRLMQGEHGDALAAFRALCAAHPNDRLAAFQLRRLEAGQQGDLIELTGK